MSSGLELANCPFCAGDGWLIEDRGDNGCEVLLYRPQCRQCGAGLGGFDHPEEAAEAWNTRTRAPSDAALVEALEVVMMWIDNWDPNFTEDSHTIQSG